MAASGGNPPLPGAIVPFRQTTPRCPTLPCPFCIFEIPHDSTAEEVCAKMTMITNDTMAQAKDLLERYMLSVNAADNVLTHLGSDRYLPAARSLWSFIDSSTNASYNALLGLVRQRWESHSESDSRSDDGVWAGAAAAASSTSRGTTRRAKRRRLNPEYPQWQFRQGKKHNKWQAYDENTNQLLESAFTRGLDNLQLRIDGWEYTVHFTSKTQVSHETGTLREVRRVEDAGHLDT